MTGEKKRILYTKLAKYYDFLVPGTTRDECLFLDKVFKSFSRTKVSRILDLGCGTGRHASLLQKMGYKVTGIDMSSEMLKVAVKKSPKSTFFKMNFLSPKFPPDSFDASICMWSTIGYILKSDKFKEFIKNISQITKDIFVFSSTNHESDSFQPMEIINKTIHLPGGEIKNKMTRCYDTKTGIREESYQYFIAENGKRTNFTDKNKLRLWKIDELKKLLSPEFKILKIYGGYSVTEKFNKYKSDKKIIIAQKCYPAAT
jgi:SAM-dependent methyltransferase